MTPKLSDSNSSPSGPPGSHPPFHKVEIWQLCTDTEDGIKARFLDYDSNLRLNGRYRPELYQQVWSGILPTDDLEEIYYIFNLAHPEDYHAPSLSVSDVVMVDDKHYFCDMIGFRSVDFHPTPSLDSRIQTAETSRCMQSGTKTQDRGEAQHPER